MHQRATRLLQRYARRSAIPCARCCWVHVGIEGGVARGGQRHCARGWSLYTNIYSVMYGVVRFAPTRVLASWLSKRALCKALPQLFKPARPTRVDGRGGSQRGFCTVPGADPCRGHTRNAYQRPSVLYQLEISSWPILALAFSPRRPSPCAPHLEAYATESEKWPLRGRRSGDPD